MRKVSFQREKETVFVQQDQAEMSRADHKFLATMLRKYGPKKIVEVGVAAGGTSSFLLKNTSPDVNIFGIDALENLYSDKTKEVGWLINELCTEDEISRYKLFKGQDPIDCIEQIGSGVDFLILDTMHVLPGELLHLLAILPFMKLNSVLILHDILLNFHPAHDPKSYYVRSQCASKLLFLAIKSHTKILPISLAPNIGAVLVDDYTFKGIESLIFALTYTWYYYPVRSIDKYNKFIEKNYSQFCYNMFQEIMLYQKKLAQYQWPY